jgi:hypothetical protein
MEMVVRGMKAALPAAVALATWTLAAAPAARAGSYHVYSCRTPSGAAAPTDGWSGSVAPNGTFDQYAKDTCAQGGALIAALGRQTAHPANLDKATWAFTPAPGTSVAGATLFRTGDTVGGGNPAASYQVWIAGPTETAIFDPCGFTLGCTTVGTPEQPLSAANRVVAPSTNIGAHIYADALCGGFAGGECPAGTGDANGYAAALYLYAADIVLEQNAGPSVTNVAGDLASAAAVRGVSGVTFSASDPGGGVYEAAVSVDGQVVQSAVLNDNGGRCRQAGQASDGRPAFLYVQPCLGALGADVGLDTTKLTNGTHHLLVNVLDAAGNSAPVLDRRITVANPPPPCAPGSATGVSASAQGSLSASWQLPRRGKHRRSLPTRITTPFGRAPTVVGRLTNPSGAAIAAATVDLVTTPAYVGAPTVALVSPQTGPDGRFSVRLPRGLTSSRLCLAYRPAGGGPALTRTLALAVRAGLSLAVAPHSASVGREIRFHGRLRGGPVPSAGKQLVLEARSPGGPWIEFKVIRTNARGLYRASYRLKFPGPADYQFRAVSEPESDYPFAAGASNVASVHER